MTKYKKKTEVQGCNSLFVIFLPKISDYIYNVTNTKFSISI